MSSPSIHQIFFLVSKHCLFVVVQSLRSKIREKFKLTIFGVTKKANVAGSWRLPDGKQRLLVLKTTLCTSTEFDEEEEQFNDEDGRQQEIGAKFLLFVSHLSCLRTQNLIERSCPLSMLSDTRL